MNKGRFPFNEQAFKFILHGWNRNVQMNTQLHVCCAGIDSGKRDQNKERSTLKTEEFACNFFFFGGGGGGGGEASCHCKVEPISTKHQTSTFCVFQPDIF